MAMVDLKFECPVHGLFSESVTSHRLASLPASLTAACPAPVAILIPFDLATRGRCTRLSPWVRSREDDDPGDEG